MTAAQGPMPGTTVGSDPAALELSGIVKTFGDFAALDGVDFSLRPGEVHALLGENGAGKSTLMNVAAGIYSADRGAIAVRGVSVAVAGPAHARRLGIGMVHQHYKLVRPFSVIENIMLSSPGGSYRRSMHRVRRASERAAADIGFAIDLDSRVDALSISVQQRVEILRVLMAGASIVILDEPTAVLTDEESERLFSAIRRLAGEGRAIALVTHKLSEALGHCDRITVMRGGRVVDTVRPADVDTTDLTRMIVGTDVVEQTKRAEAPGAPILEVAGLVRSSADGTRLLDEIGFALRRGEIYGLAGVGGNGQEQLLEALTGLTAPDAGSIVVEGHGDVAGAPPERMRALGIGCIPADRNTLALAGDLPVADNFAVRAVMGGAHGTMFAVQRRKMRRATREALARFGVAGLRGPDQKAALLSGGNAQKLVIAREFSANPLVVIAHSPSRGLDVRAAAAVHDHLRAARDRGGGVLLISEDLDEILLLSDRIGVISRGRIVAEFDSPDRQAIGKAMVGHA